ncbi:12160_t:CDS:1, partial [Gigaspora margarita]
MKFITVLVIITLSVYLINALPANLTKGQETTIVPHEHVEHKKLEKRFL